MLGYLAHWTIWSVGTEFWGLFIFFLWSSAIVWNYTFVLLFRVIEKLKFARYFSYYIHGSRTPLVGFSFGTCGLIAFRLLVGLSSDHQANSWIERIFYFLIGISALVVCKDALNKYVLIRVMREMLWKNLYGYLRKEKVLRVIFCEPKHRRQLEMMPELQAIPLNKAVKPPTIEFLGKKPKNKKSFLLAQISTPKRAT